MKNFVLSAVLIFFITGLQAQLPADGSKYLYYERYQSAEDAFKNTLQLQPGNAEAVYGLVKAHLLQNELNEANDVLNHASVLSTHPWYQVARGYVLLTAGNKDSSAWYFNQALDKTKQKDAGILIALADAHVQAKSGDAAYAIQLAEKGIKRNKKNAAYYITLGEAYRKAGNGSEAYKAYQNAIRQNNQYAAAYHKTGEIFITQNNPAMYLEYFTKALRADPLYAPAIYRMYLHYYYTDAAKAMEYYKDYITKSDNNSRQHYDLADLYYLNKQYNEAIAQAEKIKTTEGEEMQPRIYKLLGYSYAGVSDSTSALENMKQYLQQEADSNIIAKDFEITADLYATLSNTADSSLFYMDSAMAYYQQSILQEKDSVKLFAFYKKMSDLSREQKNYTEQAKWLGQFYTGNRNASNVDLFNWGLAHYLAQEYQQADTIFGKYIQEYPDQTFGYYWRAKSNVALDKDMESGLAVPHYQKLIEMLQPDTTATNYKKWMIEAYGYLAAYEANNQKDFTEAVDYFEKVLEIDPSNEDAKRYIAILEKSVKPETGNGDSNE
jgi:tetratricopeptide (TPR) repeat protein